MLLCINREETQAVTEAEICALIERAKTGDTQAEEALLRASEEVLAELAGIEI